MSQFEEDLMTEAIARHLGNSRGTPIAKDGFIKGARWAYEKYGSESKEELVKELVAGLKRALPYVSGAYECAFPNEAENENVEEAIKLLISKASGETQKEEI